MPTPPGHLVEFRNYRLVPNGLDDFVEHFERRFVESQAELGMDIVGRFRVLDEADRFVWVRRYLDPSRRAAALADFYGGPVWKEHGGRANELLVDHTDVHLLEPDASLPDFPADSGTATGSTVLAAFYDLEGTGGLPAGLTAPMASALASPSGVTELGRLATSGWPNVFPLLPVHEDVHVGLWLLSDQASGAIGSAMASAVGDATGLPCRILRLAPTPGSTLR